MAADPKTKFPKPGKNEAPQQYPGLESKMSGTPDYGLESYRGSGKLTGKVALVTGADSGIGRAVAVAFAREGADVVLSCLAQEESDAKVTMDAITDAGRKALLVVGDLREESFCTELVERAAKEFGRIDVLVNNAALQKYFKSIDEISGEDFALIYRINVIAPFLITQAAVKYMKPGSSVINTVSIQAYEPSSLLLPYAASKGGFVALTKGLAEELILKGIRVNAVAPGPIWTPLNTHASPPEKLAKFGESVKIGRPGQPIELAPVYVLLASDDASYITGEIYGVTGGEGIA